MLFYLAIIQNGNICALYTYEDKNDALALFHQELAYRGDERKSTFCLIFDEYGQILANESWKRPEEKEAN